MTPVYIITVRRDGDTEVDSAVCSDKAQAHRMYHASVERWTNPDYHEETAGYYTVELSEVLHVTTIAVAPQADQTEEERA